MKSLRLLVCFLFSVTAAVAQNNGTIFVVRHAERQSDAQDSPLSDKGFSRAKCLAETLRDAHITSVLTSQYVRTRQTAADVVRESKASEKSFNAKSYQEFVEAARQAAQSGNVLIVGHSNTVPDLITNLGGASVTVPDNSYDQLFILEVRSPKNLTILHYCPDLPADATQHAPNSMAKP